MKENEIFKWMKEMKIDKILNIKEDVLIVTGPGGNVYSVYYIVRRLANQLVIGKAHHGERIQDSTFYFDENAAPHRGLFGIDIDDKDMVKIIFSGDIS